jgi:hypothetical protein
VAAIEKHFVEFTSPGTFFHEETPTPIDAWDVGSAVAMAKGIKERLGAAPCGFQFVTRLCHEPIADGKGGTLKVESRELRRSGTHFITGRVITFEDAHAGGEPMRILRDNMRINDWPLCIENTNTWPWKNRYEPGDCIVDWDGRVIDRGDSPERMAYREATLAKFERMREERIAGWNSYQASRAK